MTYKERLRLQVDKYGGDIRAERVESVRRFMRFGEHSLAANDFVMALVDERVAIAQEDAAVLRTLLEEVQLPPDTPHDIADRLITTD
jgi:hypothetical protein